MTELERVLFRDPVYRSLPPRPRWDDDIREAVRLANIDVASLRRTNNTLRTVARILQIAGAR
jgi:hypothetical protein